jgi:hypothetical protein
MVRMTELTRPPAAAPTKRAVRDSYQRSVASVVQVWSNPEKCENWCGAQFCPSSRVSASREAAGPKQAARCGGRMSEEVRFGHNIFGYTTLVREGDTFIALTGEGEQELRLGMTVVLLGDSRGYVPSGFSPSDEVTILGFTEPFKNGESDHIVKVSNETTQGWVKPSNIQRSMSVPTASTPSDRRHQEMRKHVHPAPADLLDAVYLAMSEQERLSLPDDIGPYVDALVAHALRSGELQGMLAQTIARVHAESTRGDRFIKDPLRSTSISTAILFLDPDGELVTVKNPEIVRDTSNPPAQVLKRYESYEVLTGRLAGKKFSWPANALGEPIYKGGPESRVEAQAAPAAFFSYSREDSDFALRLAGDLKAAGANVWLDQLDIKPGDRWDRTVEDALTNCPRVVVILSPASVNSTNVMDEVSFALEEKKTVIPVIYRDCTIPYRLRRVQHVDFRQDYARGVQELLKILAPGQKAGQISSAISGVASKSQSPVSDLDEYQRALVKLTVRGTYSNEKLQGAQPWKEVGHCRFHRDSEVAADPVFDLVVENTSGGSLLLLKTGIRILQRKPGTGGVMGYAKPIKVQAEYSVHCYEEWKRFNLNDKEVWKNFENPMWMKKDDSPFRFTLCLENFCDPDNASSSEIRFCLQTSSGTVESESIWLEQ